MKEADYKQLYRAIDEITEIARVSVLIFIRCAMKFVRRILFIHLVLMGCQRDFHIGVLENNFIK